MYMHAKNGLFLEYSSLESNAYIEKPGCKQEDSKKVMNKGYNLGKRSLVVAMREPQAA